VISHARRLESVPMMIGAIIPRYLRSNLLRDEFSGCGKGVIKRFQPHFEWHHIMVSSPVCAI